MKDADAAIRILVVEDEPGIAEVCLRVIMRQGYQADIAGNGIIAENLLREKDYDLVIIDIRTPVMNGKQLYQHIKEVYPPKLINSVVFTTGDVVSNETRLFLEESGRPFLPKPFTPDELEAVVGEALGRRHQLT